MTNRDWGSNDFVTDHVKTLEKRWWPIHWPDVYRAMRNQNFAEGRQRMTWAEGLNTFVPQEDDSNLHLTFNWTGNIVYGIVNLLIKDLPEMDVLPVTPESYRERLAVRMANATLRSDLYANDWNTRVMEAAYCMLVHAIGFHKISFNDRAGEYLPVSGATEVRGREGQNEIATRRIYDIWHPPGITYLDDALEMFERALLDKDVIEALWGKGTADDAPHDPNDIRFRVMESGGEGTNIPSGGPSQSDANLLPVTEYWRRPMGDCPKGLHLIYCGTKVLFREDWPLDVNGNPLPFPYVEYKNRYHPYKLVPDAFVDALIDPQAVINAMFSSFVQNARAHADHRYVIEEDSLEGGIEDLEPDPARIHQVRTRDGQSVKDAIHRIVGEAPNGAWITGIQEAVEQIRNLGHYLPFRTGGGVTNVRTASGLALIQENADTQSLMWSLTFRRGFRRVGEILLKLAQKNYRDKRLLRYAGTDGEVVVQSFRKTEMSQSTQVELDMNSKRSTSRVARTQEAITLLGLRDHAGVPIIDAAQFRRLVALKSTIDMSNLEGRNRNVAERENLKFADYAEARKVKGAPVDMNGEAGTDKDVAAEIALVDQWIASGGNPQALMGITLRFIPKPRLYEDHDVHIEEHTLFRMLGEYMETYAPYVEDIIDAHDRMHTHLKIALATRKAAEQAALMQNVQGMMPPAPGGAESPAAAPPQAGNGLGAPTLLGYEASAAPQQQEPMGL